MRIILFLVLLITSTSFIEPPSKGSLKEVVAFISGSFSTQAQRKSLPDSVLYNFAPNKPWLSELYASHIVTDIPALGSNVVYIEWREKSFTGPLSRQRLWHFKEVNGKLQRDFYAFKYDSLWKDVAANPIRLKDITTNDLTAFPEGCSLSIEYEKGVYRAVLDSATCSVVTQRTGRSMRLFAEIIIDKKGFDYREKGILPNGSYAFVVPGFAAYAFRK